MSLKGNIGSELVGIEHSWWGTSPFCFRWEVIDVNDRFLSFKTTSFTAAFLNGDICNMHQVTEEKEHNTGDIISDGFVSTYG